MIKAVIFDMDGVISDTQKLHSSVESDLLKRYGVSLSPAEITQKYSGVSTKEFFKKLLGEKYKSQLDCIMKEKWIKMEELAKAGVDSIPGAIDLLKDLKDNRISVGLASASRIKYINAVINKLGIVNYFDAISSSDEVRKGKPAPDIFLLTAQKIKVRASDCVVIEDGISGMQAAKQAGMKCIALVDENNKDNNYPADKIISSLKNLDSSFIRSLI